VKKFFWILSFLVLPLLAEATHQVAGYIYFKHISGLTYQATFVDFVNGDPYNNPTECGDPQDRDTMRIYYGDGGSDVVIRSNGPIDPNNFPGGDSICPCRKVCLYTSPPHTFPGAGSYHIWVYDVDRMWNITNIPNSANTSFYVFTSINIRNSATEDISSPVITNPLTCQNACMGQCYYYNPGAYSAAGDSMVYSLGNCLYIPNADLPPAPLNYGENIPLYAIPPGTTIDPQTGTLEWCTPTTAGIFNFSIRIISYHKYNLSGVSGDPSVDTMDVEVEVNVSGSCSTHDPTITGQGDTCIVAGTFLNMFDTAKDADKDPLTVTASGDPFTLSPPATFTTTGADPVYSKFNWQTDCSDVRSSPYQVIIKATDNGSPSVSSYKVLNIHVVAPAPTNLKATVSGNSVYLHWNPSICPQTTGYQIYRAKGCIPFTQNNCETGVSPSSGFAYIGSTTGLDDTTYTDNNVIPGISYSYLVIAAYPLPDGSLSYASNYTCVTIKRDLPLITNVSVENTSTAGTIFIRWVKPLTGNGYLDTIVSPGPYKYRLSRATGMNGIVYLPIDSVTIPYFGSLTDTTFKDITGLNTLYNSYRYKLDFYYSGNTYLGSSPPASSIYLTTKPGNHIVNLTWTSNVPWIDSAYLIYRNSGSGFNYLTAVAGNIHSYTDSMLVDRHSYCYYVESKSYYADPTILRPLYDSSEVQCATPIDTVPPCQPMLTVSAECNAMQDSLIWTDPDHSCKNTNDVVLYNIYYSPTLNGDMQIIATINNINDTVFINKNVNSIAGCYSVTAVDSFGNESKLSAVCVDNCPQYTLPNVFTPNGDGFNDLFTPILPFRYIKSIDISIYNRWGQVMFHTINPLINWDGKDQVTRADCPDGVYYYICVVNEIRVDGVQPITLKGFVELIR